MHPIISIIVPCYNIKEYVGRCLDSLTAQSFSNYEVICIDDGSTDGTSDVLNRYAKEHPAIRVVSQGNAGLAEARNSGVSVARGEYVSFVDGDDFVSSRYLELLWASHAKSGADLVVSDLAVVSAKGIDRLMERWEGENDCDYHVVERGEVGSMLMLDELSCAACGKLVNKEICQRHPFTPGRFHEDVEVITEYYLESSVCAHLGKPQYGYFMRVGSITHSLSPSEKQRSDFIEAYARMEQAVSKSLGCSAESLAYHRAIMACRYHDLVERRGERKMPDSRESELIASAFEAIDLLETPQLPKHTRERLVLLSKSPVLYDVIFSLYNLFVKGRG